jgi:exonuclease III
MLAMFPFEENNFATVNTLDFNFSTQNVRSLNISTKNVITEQKILAIVKGGCDIIFLSDLRLNSLNQSTACKELVKTFYLHGYKFIHNSKISSRGVGILINRKILDVVTIHSVNRDINCNYLLVDIEFPSGKYTIGSVYGANTNDGISMYMDLERDVKSFKNGNIILGGDWNATWSLEEVERNIDVLNMVNVPSIRRSRAIRSMCDNLDITDPYRIFYPDTREYTFTPSGINQLNRSRLDFFLVSKNLCDKIVNVIIPHALSSTTFDHKNVNLLFSKRKGNFKFFVKDTFLENDEFKCTIHLAVVECYVQHAAINNHFTEETKAGILNTIGRT